MRAILLCWTVAALFLACEGKVKPPPSPDVVDSLTMDMVDGDQEVCSPICTGKSCGSNGCTGECGVCTPGSICHDHQCVSPDGICIAVAPSTVHFGGIKHGEQGTVPVEIAACGFAPLEIHDINLTESSSPDFDIDMTTVDHIGRSRSSCPPSPLPTLPSKPTSPASTLST